MPLDRLRKEVAHQRFLARLARAAPDGSWVLKGGQALLARLDEHARATKDADATWRASVDSFGETLEDATGRELHDYFAFEVGEPRGLTTETDEGGLRYRMLALVADREFERLQLDVNFVPTDRRQLDHIRLRNLLGFAGVEPPYVPIVPLAQHLAEKLHAYTRHYVHHNSRPRDLFDMLIIARWLSTPSAGELTQACRQTFELRRTPWPPELSPPPPAWATSWAAYRRDHSIPWRNLDDAYKALRNFWGPVLVAQAGAVSRWDPATWRWR